MDYVPNVANEWGDKMKKLVGETRTGIFQTTPVYRPDTIKNEALRNLLFNAIFGNLTGLMLMNRGESGLSKILLDFYRQIYGKLTRADSTTKKNRMRTRFWIRNN